jgi:glutathione S-transferase
VRTAPSQHDTAAIAQASERAAGHYRRLDAQLANQPFVAGEALTMGDIPVGATLFRYFTLEIERPDLPHLEAYYARLQERPAYREHVMISFEAMRVTD